jgi:hypothetical protein
LIRFWMLVSCRYRPRRADMGFMFRNLYKRCKLNL